MSKTAGYSVLDHKYNFDISEDLQKKPIFKTNKKLHIELNAICRVRGKEQNSKRDLNYRPKGIRNLAQRQKD